MCVYVWLNSDKDDDGDNNDQRRRSATVGERIETDLCGAIASRLATTTAAASDRSIVVSAERSQRAR